MSARRIAVLTFLFVGLALTQDTSGSAASHAGEAAGRRRRSAYNWKRTAPL